MVLLSLLTAALAQGKITLPNPISGDEVSSIVNEAKPGALWVAFGKSMLVLVVIAAVVMIIYGGFVWLTARGEKEKITTARDTLVWVVLGLVVVAVAYVVLKFVLGGLADVFMQK